MGVAPRLPRPAEAVGAYPFELSGGMRQRVMIALALSCSPRLLIADEPTTALDVTVQAQVMTLLSDLQKEMKLALILITHDMGVVAETADDIVVMYAARVAEQAPVYSLFEQPLHPYTWGLLGSLPRLDADVERLVQIQGQPPSLLRPPAGCRFHPRCPYVLDVCGRVVPDPRLLAIQPDTRLSGQLSAFGLDGPGKAVVVTFDGTIARTGSDSIQSRRFSARVPVESEQPDIVAAALNQAANQVAGEVADWIGR